jgi:hypothetical protein
VFSYFQSTTNIKSFILLIVLLCLGNLLLFSPSQAYPVLPSSFYGTIQVDGTNVEPGTSIKALIGGQAFAEEVTLVYEGVSVYTIHVPGDHNDTHEVDGGREGEQITFLIGGLVAAQSGTWHSGTNVELNLTVSSQDQDSETNAVDTPSPTQGDQETTGLITPTEFTPGSSKPTPQVPTPTPLPAQSIPKPTRIAEAIPAPITVNNPEPSLADAQADVQSEIIEQGSSDKISSANEASTSVDQFGILSSTVFFLVLGGIIVIGAAAILIWAQRR